ncbi:glycosyltransferase family 39 protein [Mycolicibacterium madagascariense]|nr:glycosyltransferase family 39 protein [Mycolicibacterium madagascariense]MCV7012747.1 glycosyltransferase family 39 protein [Mycolicibacterium madagascariense]
MSDAAVAPEAVAAADEVARPHRLRPGWDPVLVAILTIGISAAGASRPSSWFDEAATISAATRPLTALWRLLQHIDAVHGLYYYVMHGWFALVPVTEFSSRAPSCLAVGVAGAGVVVLARKFCDRPVAVCAGVVFAVLPRTTWAGVEARSYAFTAMAAVWLTVVLVVAIRRNRPWHWLLYLLLLVAAILLNAFMVLLVAVYAVGLAVLSPRRAAVACWVVTTAVGTGLATPFLLFSRTQMGQVAWISPLNHDTVIEVFQNQYFDGSTPFAIIGGVLVVAAVLSRLLGAPPAGPGVGRLTVLAVAWMAIPTATLLLFTVFAAPIYYPRYLCFTSPAVALLLGACVARIARSPGPAALLLLVLAVAAAPNYVLVQRAPYKREGMDYSEIADVVTRHAHPGDCLLLDNTTSWKPGPIRPLLASRPAAYRGLVDLGRGARATTTDRLWDGFVPVWTVQDRLRRCSVIWTVSEHDWTRPAHESGVALAPGPRLGSVPVYQIPFRMGFRIVERWQFNFAQITKSMRWWPAGR